MTESEEVLAKVLEAASESPLYSNDLVRLLCLLHETFYSPIIQKAERPKKNLKEVRPATPIKVRPRDPSTSWDAAVAQTPEKSQRLYRIIYFLLVTRGPMTDDELRASLDQNGVSHSGTGVTKRRGELVDAGWLRATDKKRLSAFGSPMTVWEAISEG